MNKTVKYILVAISPLLILTGLFSYKTATDQRYFQIAKNLEILSSIYAEVNRYYVDEIDPTTFMEEGINSMLASLDPYTNYIAEDEIEDFRFISTGQYGGVGAVISSRKERILVIMPYKGFPAYEAGLKIGDEIVEIDGHLVTGKNSNEISQLLKGQAGTVVNVKIKRYGQEELIPVEINREKITVKNVPFSGMVTDEIGYFKLNNFTMEAGKEIEEAIKGLKEQGAKKFIFDLRGNTGGLLKEAIDISNLFIPKGSEIVSTRGKSKKWTNTYFAEHASLDEESPLVVLVDGRSASASEIVSGVIQDYDRGVLIGDRTFGKGLVQATIPTVYNTQVKITTAKYYIPSGRCIQALDYSKRDKNGKVPKLPDSLLTEYTTARGRTVYDGAGIEPDINIENEIFDEVLIHLVTGDYIFDYATQYYYNKDTISGPREFKLSDNEFGKFKTWLKKEKFSYKIALERDLAELKEELEIDSTLSLNLSDEFVAFENKIEEYKSQDLDRNKEMIKRMLEEEIISRYYLEDGVIEASFQHDKEVQKALSVLNDQTKYNSLLASKTEK